MPSNKRVRPVEASATEPGWARARARAELLLYSSITNACFFFVSQASTSGANSTVREPGEQKCRAEQTAEPSSPTWMRWYNRRVKKFSKLLKSGA